MLKILFLPNLYRNRVYIYLLLIYRIIYNTFILKSLVRFKRLTLRSSPLPKKGRGILLRLSQYKESRIVCPLSCHTEIEVGKGFPSMFVLALSSPSSTACASLSLRIETTYGGV